MRIVVVFKGWERFDIIEAYADILTSDQVSTLKQTSIDSVWQLIRDGTTVTLELVRSENNEHET